MRKKIFTVLNNIYGIMMSVSFFAGILPLPAFIFALIVGGELGETISVFLYKGFYPWVIIVGSIALVIGLIAMYVGKLEGLSVKKVATDDTKEEEK